MLGARRARRVGARGEVLAGVVVEREDLREALRHVAIDVVARGTRGEHVRPREPGGDAGVELHGVVERALELGLLERDRRGRVLAQEQALLVRRHRGVHLGVGVREHHGELPRELLPERPDRAGEEIALAARRAAG
ncbi:MAG: hypothetical protein ACK559_23075, partial [bacterium]